MWNRIKNLFSGKANTTVKRRRILVVDDDNTVCKLVESVLSKKNYEVLVAKDGQEGFEKAVAERPDLIFLDCLMPGIHGVDVGKKLKENSATKDIPILFLTSVDTPKNIIDCYELGAENYLVKPIRPSELIKQVEMNLQDAEPT